MTIKFETSDCSLGGHFGYAYIAVDCAPLTVYSTPPQPCIGGNTILTAQPGFATYSWTGPGLVGSTTASTATANVGGTYSVTMTTFANAGSIGCTLGLPATFTNSTIAPVASFSATTACLDVGTQFADLSTLLPNQGTLSAWSWNFGDGDSSHLNNPTHTYLTAGTFPVNYTITSSVDCKATYSLMVTVNPLPSPSFIVAPVCQGTATSFTNTSTGAASYNWNFGDATGSSININPTHTYSASGAYVTTLTAETALSCTASTTNTVLVNFFPTVNFSAPPVCFGSQTAFSNSSSAITGYSSWNFGDLTNFADTSNAQTPTYTYPSAGTYTVTLTLYPSDGCVSTKTNTVLVNPIPAISVTSTQSIVVCWNKQVPAPTLLKIPNSPGMTYVWSNSNPVIGLASTGTGIPPGFVSGINNTSNYIDGVISITPTLNGCVGLPTTYTVSIVPTAIVKQSNLNYCPGDIVPAITLTATPAAATPNITWSTTAMPFIGLPVKSGGNVIPSFNAISNVTTAQTNVIALQDSLGGCFGPVSYFSITINANPTAKFSYASACTGNPTNFTDESVPNSGAITQWIWNFGDNSSNLENPSYQLTTTGNQTVTLEVTTNYGCKNEVTETVYVSPSATVSFSADTVGCNPLTTTFTGVISMPVKSVSWNFGNGNIINSAQTVATQTFVNNFHTQNANFSVSFSVVTDSGCVSNLTKNNYITVHPKPLAGFAYEPTNANVLNPTVNFYDQSIGASGVNAYNWNFGDVYETVDSLGSSTIANPIHIYSDVPYSYQVMQIVDNIYGCKDTIIETVVIYDAVTFYIPNAFSPNGDGTNDGFKGTGIGIDDATYNLWVFDRWGLMIFHSTDLETSWDGRLNGTKVQEDVYVWKVNFRDVFNKLHDYHGTVTVLK